MGAICVQSALGLGLVFLLYDPDCLDELTLTMGLFRLGSFAFLHKPHTEHHSCPN